MDKAAEQAVVTAHAEDIDDGGLPKNSNDIGKYDVEAHITTLDAAAQKKTM